MKKLLYLWNDWKERLQIWWKNKFSAEEIVPYKPKTTVSIGSTKAQDIPRRGSSKPVPLGQINNRQTAPIGRVSYDLPKKVIPGQDGILDGDGNPEFEFELIDDAVMSREELEEYRVRMNKDEK